MRRPGASTLAWPRSGRQRLVEMKLVRRPARPTQPLGGGFFPSRRLPLKSSQVGGISPPPPARADYRRRLILGSGLAADPVVRRSDQRRNPFEQNAANAWRKSLPTVMIPYAIRIRY